MRARRLIRPIRRHLVLALLHRFKAGMALCLE
jgi:hypothetical protein